MNILDTRNSFLDGRISKPEFIRAMYQEHHFHLMDYAKYLKLTNIASIEIADDVVMMTSRDKGVKMICPAGDHRVAPIEALNFLDYESDDSAMIIKLASSSRNFIDIGANMGWYSINIAKTYPHCTVHAFEPIPKTYQYLIRNIDLNNLKNIEPHPFGLSNEKKDLIFYFYGEGSGNASSKNLSERDDADLITCHVQRLDDFISEHQITVDFIKCDVEGAELFAFEGAYEVLKRDKPIVFTEMLRKWAAKFDYHPNQIIKLFSDIGYRCFYSQRGGLKEIVEMTDQTVETNFYFLHKTEHKHQLLELETL